MLIKVLGVVLVVVALLGAAVPAFTSCSSEGLFITTQDGRQIDMKCYWTSRASIPAGVALGAVGMMLTFSRRKESRRFLGITGGILGATFLALPTELIGVCSMDKLCLNVMKPSLILLGITAMVVSAGVVVFAGNGLKGDDAQS